MSQAPRSSPQSGKIVGAASDLISVLPTMERAVDLASPLGGAIDRFGRIVDRFPGGAPQRRREPVPDVEIVVDLDVGNGLRRASPSSSSEE